MNSGTVAAKAGYTEDVAAMTPKEDLFSIAIDIFSKKGFYGTSIRDIAGARGVSVSNVYNHYKNKEDLWIAIKEHSVGLLLDAWSQRIKPNAGPLERFTELVKAHFEFYTAYQKEARISVSFSDELSNRGNARIKALQRKVLDRYVQHLEELREAGIISETKDTKIIAFNVLGVLNAYVGWYRPNGPMPPEIIEQEVIEFVCAGALASLDRTASINR